MSQKAHFMRKSRISAHALGGMSFLAAIVSATVVHGQCRSEVGKSVEMITPPQLVVQLSALDLKKGEFETTQEFAKRRSVALAGASPKAVVISAAVDPKFIRYDADSQRFVIERFAWANVTGGFETVFGIGNRYGVAPMNLLDDAHGLGLLIEERAAGTYQASNAYGRTLTVTKVERARYSAFDRRRQPQEQTWRYDFGRDREPMEVSSPTPGIVIPMRREQAPTVKQGLRFGVEFTPREPFIAIGTEAYPPRVDRPTDIVETITVFTGKMGCLVVTDATGIALRVVPSGYR